MAALGKSGKPVSLGLPTFLRLHRLPEAVALAIHLENGTVVGQAVQESRGHALALEDLAPFAEGEVARHQEAPSFVSVGMSMDPNRYAVSEPELLRTLRLSGQGGFLQDHPGIAAFSGTTGFSTRALLAPPRSGRKTRASISIVTRF